MNNRIKLYVIISIFLSFSCKTSKGTVTLTQKKTQLPIIIKLNGTKKYITSIKYPNSIKIKNNSNFYKSFIKLNYSYKDSLSNWANRSIELFEIKNGKTKKISNNKKKNIPPNSSIQYFYYTRHFIDSSRVIQEKLKPYVLKELTKDTIHIGTVAEFKKKHEKLFDQLTKKDSISIRFLDKGKLGKPITVRVKW